VDGRELCTTPCHRDLPEGEHALELRLPDHLPVHLRLEVREAAEVRQTLSPSKGRLTVVTTPAGATVEVGGRPIGTTPLEDVVLAPGEHRVRLVVAQHRESEVTAVVRPGEETRLEQTLEPRLGRLDVEAVDWAGRTYIEDVLVDGQPVGVTPWSGELLTGIHVVDVAGRTRNVWIREEEPKTVKVTVAEAPTIPEEEVGTEEPPGPAPAIPAFAAQQETAPGVFPDLPEGPMWPALASLGAGGVLLAAGGAVALLRSGTIDELEAAKSLPVTASEVQELHDAATSYTYAANILLGLGGAAVVVATVLASMNRHAGRSRRCSTTGSLSATTC